MNIEGRVGEREEEATTINTSHDRKTLRSETYYSSLIPIWWLEMTDDTSALLCEGYGPTRSKQATRNDSWPELPLCRSLLSRGAFVRGKVDSEEERLAAGSSRQNY